MATKRAVIKAGVVDPSVELDAGIEVESLQVLSTGPDRDSLIVMTAGTQIDLPFVVVAEV